MIAILTLMRPKQWIKNVVVLAGVVFAGRLSDGEFVRYSLAAFAVFCMLSSAIYVFNDVIDAEKDRNHPEKRKRPIAAGEVGRGQGVVLALVLVAVGLGAEAEVHHRAAGPAGRHRRGG